MNPRNQGDGQGYKSYKKQGELKFSVQKETFMFLDAISLGDECWM